MKTKDCGSFFNVTVSADDVSAFNDTWPCSPIPRKRITFQFQKSNGDLVDIWPSSVAFDGDALVALIADAQKQGEKDLAEMSKPKYRKGSFQAKMASMLSGYPEGTTFDVLAHELCRDDGCWSVNDSWRIAKDADLDDAIYAAHGRWEVFKCNYGSKSRVADLSDENWSGPEFSALINCAGTPFLEIRPNLPETANA